MTEMLMELLRAMGALALFIALTCGAKAVQALWVAS